MNKEHFVKLSFGIWLANEEILSLAILSCAGCITHRHKEFRQFPWGQWRTAAWRQLGMGHRLLMYFSYLLLPCWSQLFLRHSCQQTWGTERRLVPGVTMMPLIDAAPVNAVALGQQCSLHVFCLILNIAVDMVVLKQSLSHQSRGVF